MFGFTIPDLIVLAIAGLAALSGLRRGVARMAVLTAAILVALVVIRRVDAGWAARIAASTPLAVGTSTWLLQAAAIALATLLGSFIAGLVVRRRPGRRSRVLGALLGAVLALATVATLLEATDRYVSNSKVNGWIAGSELATSLHDHASLLLALSGMMALGSLLLLMLVPGSAPTDSWTEDLAEGEEEFLPPQGTNPWRYVSPGGSGGRNPLDAGETAPLVGGPPARRPGGVPSRQQSINDPWQDEEV